MYRIIKRVLDLLLAFAALLVLAVPMLVIALITVADSPGPALFRQKRVAIGKGTFQILKFRSMPVSAPSEVPTHLLTEEIPLTGWQRWLRRSSADELPQLLCILCGSMSFCGPRPALWNQQDLVEERDRYGANDVRPGLTGLAQISGRDMLGIPEKARLDGEYAAAMRRGGLTAFRMDCRCFFGTFFKVLRGDDIA